jgi:hypothetical protein
MKYKGQRSVSDSKNAMYTEKQTKQLRQIELSLQKIINSTTHSNVLVDNLKEAANLINDVWRYQHKNGS